VRYYPTTLEIVGLLLAVVGPVLWAVGMGIIVFGTKGVIR